jgi:hypothetical protein
VKANCTEAVQSEKVCFVESCLGRELKGVASFPASTSSPDTTISEETISRTVSLKEESPVQCLQVSVSRPLTVHTPIQITNLVQ